EGEEDGRTTGDIVVPGDPAAPILLRAERAGQGSGRAYVIVDSAIDASGNRTRSLAVVTVPHDLGQGPEPLYARVEPLLEPGAAPGSTRLYWSAGAGALGYDGVAGDVASLRLLVDRIDVGPVRWLARRAAGAAWSEDAAIGPVPVPPVGRALFYLVQYWSG